MEQFEIIFLRIIALLVVAIAANPAEWESFKQNYDKKYRPDADERTHMKIFFENLKEIVHHNELFEAGKVPNKMGINEFSDMTDDEFYSTMTGFVPDISDIEEDAERVDMPYDTEMPISIDWRAKGAVTYVKNQRRCNSCWTFGMLGAVEGQHFLKTGKLISLSEQNLVDCVRENETKCYGGSYRMAYNYIRRNGGIESEKTYPYTGRKGDCKYNPENAVATIRDYVRLPQNEVALTYAIATVGPIAVGIHALGLKNQMSGTYYQPNCSTTINHYVLAVGYGSDEKGDYYIVKNSWGRKWGENGFFKMARNRNDNCGISTYANYPIV